jgi:D-alanyl-D-alanine carboxypeptidase
MFKFRVIAICLLAVTIPLAGCSGKNLQAVNKPKSTENPTQAPAETETKPVDNADSVDSNDNSGKSTEQQTQDQQNQNQQSKQPAPEPKPTTPQKDDSIEVVSQPESIPVLVNKQNKLPDSYIPNDLVTTTIPFVSTATSEKRKMRSEAATALTQLFEGAKQKGISLLGVSAYRSHVTQTALFNHYVKIDGYEKARTYSAIPGTSEHETGLAIDVTGGNGKCAADDCFGGTAEANWLQAHVAEYGYIIRYPKGKDSITGYKYEPWHIRYVGKAIATQLMNSGITLEEYYHNVPVTK